MTQKLSQSEKQSIIMNEEKGILHPLYYVCKMKNGAVQIRKRKIPLNAAPAPQVAIPQTKEEDKEDIITNRMLLEKMVSILEKNSISNDMNLNPIEREKETKENKEYVESIQEKRVVFDEAPLKPPEQPVPQMPQQQIRRRPPPRARIL